VAAGPPPGPVELVAAADREAPAQLPLVGGEHVDAHRPGPPHGRPARGRLGGAERDERGSEGQRRHRLAGEAERAALALRGDDRDAGAEPAEDAAQRGRIDRGRRTLPGGHTHRSTPRTGSVRRDSGSAPSYAAWSIVAW